MEYDSPSPRTCAKMLTREKVMIVIDGVPHVVVLVDAMRIAQDIQKISEAAK